MFLGIFSSIIPYLIAAGFYLLWMAVSFVQPHFQKNIEEKHSDRTKNFFSEKDANLSVDSHYDFENFQIENEHSGSLSPPPVIHPPKTTKFYKQNHYADPHPPRDLFFFERFSRPPPAC